MSISKALDFFAAEYPDISSYYFVITDSGIAGFSKISGITLCSNEYKPFTEGGLKGVHLLAEQDKQVNTLTLEKGVGRMDLPESLGQLKTFIIVSVSRRRIPKRAYAVSGAVLQKITVSDMNAESSSVLINSVTIAYNKIEDMPLSGLVDELLPSANAAAGMILSGGISGAAKEIGAAAKMAGNGLLETFKAANAAAEKIGTDKLLKKTEEKLGELAFWE